MITNWFAWGYGPCCGRAHLHVVGEAGDGLKAITLVERLQPDLLVLDLMMPGLGGMEVNETRRKSSPDMRIVVLSMHSNEAYVVKALRLGANAYVLKESLAADLIQAVRESLVGRTYLSPPLSDLVIKSYTGRSQSAVLTPTIGSRRVRRNSDPDR